MARLTYKADQAQFCYQQGWDDAMNGLVGNRYTAGTSDATSYRHGHYDGSCLLAKMRGRPSPVWEGGEIRFHLSS